MGLAIGVGVLADLIIHDAEGADWMRTSIEGVNQALEANELPQHDEPESFATPLHELCHGCTSFPYSFLHYLRRAYAHMREGQPVPDDNEMRPEHDSVIEDAAMMMDSHLLCHSDAEGHYVPIDFSDVIFDDELVGGMLGSSQALLRELIEVAPHIDVTLEGGRPTPACEAQLRVIEDSGRLWRERLVWYTLFEAATISIEHRTLIVFH
ncbi:hypothetical protein DB30_02780 [Enhygromyxa salina]|uniref:Uncharacterized protein n=1 Tax=Enhygromyxa salina TaxID=215803 RepID=A0A0C2DDN4_9BACT|nr:hypothetical protein [Enhygromyxa salina]KIG17747.1 hypothetical protein DB30_02780 [Enhygromyxa salina]